MKFAAKPEKPLDGFGIFGVVKETGVDDEGLSTFYSKYFTKPLYRDEGLKLYNALGGKKLGLSFLNPYKLFKFSKRAKKKNLEGNFKGEGLLKGGVIIFGKDGKPKYAYQEQTGSELPVDDIGTAAQAVRETK